MRRFRPIVMTTLTTVLGMLPIAIGIGEGGELQAPMARVVIGGLLSGSIITLIVMELLFFLTYAIAVERWSAYIAAGAAIGGLIGLRLVYPLKPAYINPNTAPVLGADTTRDWHFRVAPGELWRRDRRQTDDDEEHGRSHGDAKRRSGCPARRGGIHRTGAHH